MLAIVADSGRLSWQAVPDATPGPGEVLLRVTAAGVNRADLLQAAGNYPPPPGASDIIGLEVSGVIESLGADLGESDVANLAPQFQQFARTGEVGTVSTPIRTPLGLHLVAVCGRRVGGPEAPSRQQVENRLRSQNLQVLERRYLRDLRSDALIEFK